MMNRVFLLFFIIMQFRVFSQTHELNSLLIVLKSAKEDTLKVKTLQAIANIKNDEQKYTEALAYNIPARDLAEKLKFKRGIARAYRSIAYSYDWMAYTTTGDYSQVEPNYLKALGVYKELHDTNQMAGIMLQLGYSLDYQADYSSANNYYFQSLRYYESLNDSNRVARLLFLLGQSNKFQNNYPKAFEYLFRSVASAKQLKDKAQEAESYLIIGNTHMLSNNLDSALFYLDKALEMRLKIDEIKNDLGEIYYNMSKVYFKKHDYKQALVLANKAFDYSDLQEDTYQQAELYGHIGDCYAMMNDNNTAIDNYLKSIKISRISGSKNITNQQYLNLSKVYEKTGKVELAFDYYKKHIALKDSVFNDRKSKESERAELQYVFDKQQLTQKAEQEKADAIAAEKLNQQKRVTNIFIAGFILIIFFSFFLYRSYSQKKKILVIVNSQNIELEEQKERVHLQKVLLEEKNKEMTDSINYAKRIQNSVLLEPAAFEGKFKEAFLLFKPKDIVSGDFYWLAEYDDFIFYATVDCTGHGVPGGFMSMLGNSFLNQIIVDKKITEPGEILDVLRVKIILALQQKDAKDGMDMVLCRLNKKSNELVYAAANNPLWLMRNNELIEYPADKQPVGLSEGKTLQYRQHVIPLLEGDRIYTFTDGYADQFGGKNGKKFKKTAFKELIKSISQKSMSEQKKIVNETIETWRAGHEQVDDITVIGVRV